MARTFSLPAQNYAPGTYGPFSVDNFNKNDTSEIVLDVSRADVGDWPAIPLLFTVSLGWDSGGGAGATFSGNPTDKTGLPLMAVSLSMPIPKLGVAKRDVGRGDLAITVHGACRASATLRAVA